LHYLEKTADPWYVLSCCAALWLTSAIDDAEEQAAREKKNKQRQKYLRNKQWQEEENGYECKLIVFSLHV
jgi:hypothetical protein